MTGKVGNWTNSCLTNRPQGAGIDGLGVDISHLFQWVTINTSVLFNGDKFQLLCDCGDDGI